MKASKLLSLIAINSLVLGLILLIVEVAYKGYRVLRPCLLNRQCSLQNLRIANPYENPFKTGLSTPDKELGYSVTPNFKDTINTTFGWHNVAVSTDKHGLRDSGEANNPKLKIRPFILSVGDSFTFGDQVSDQFTWQSCLNRNQNKTTVLNGGVFGYGTAHALKRAQVVRESKPIQGIIISTTVGSDFVRDQAKFLFGFPRPSVIKQGENITQSPPPDPNVAGSKYLTKPGIESLKQTWFELLQQSIIANKTNTTNPEISSRYLSSTHPDAAPVNEIIEWTVQQSKQLGIPAIWLLQYWDTADQSDKVLQEREFLKQTFQANNIPYIDTYEVLFSKENSHAAQKQKLWKSHHTPMGNEVVCQVILSAPAFQKLQSEVLSNS
mgnify:CR=1 FL=1